MTNWQTFSDLVAERVRKVRKSRGMTAQDLAEKCATPEVGAPEITAQTLSNIETGRRDKDGRRRRAVTVDEFMSLAAALQIQPVDLLVPPELDDDAPFSIAPGAAMTAGAARDWISGVGFLPSAGPAEMARALQEMPKSRQSLVATRWLQRTNRSLAQEQGDQDGGESDG
ncbi:helix-turn-helix domain-containing protein [Streptomyces sp. NPDC002187]|uniref:helix-turn-helix domain-containing protein n=1 Tax=Streptomyces sp. NPDC002187 TaxID=3364637 RepID=UPI0036758309